MPKDVITFKEFQDLDLRVARVLSAARVEGTDKLMVLEIDIGTEQRQIVAGIAEDYTTGEMIGKDIMVIVNLQPAKIRGVESKGMLLAANLEGIPVLACFDRPVTPGAPVT